MGKKAAPIPTAVLERARLAAKGREPAKRTVPQDLHPPRSSAAREKVIAALKRLHPMD